MRSFLAILALLATSVDIQAGCIGPVIMGKCEGEVVEWDTHPNGFKQAPTAFPHDRRGTPQDQRGWVDPDTGIDAHDARWHW